MNEQYASKDVAVRVANFLENPRIISSEPGILLGEFIVACQILGVIGDPAAVPTLINQMKQCGGNTGLSSRYFMKAAADALTGIKEQAVKSLTELLKSEHTETRKFAAYALGKIGNREVFPALEKIFNDPYEPEMVREVAGRALLQLDPEKAAETVHADSLTPIEDPTEQPKIKDDVKLINQYYNSLDDLGPPSEYKQSTNLYDYVEEVVYDNLYEKLEWEGGFDPERFDDLAQKLDLPREIIDKVEKIGIHFLLCLCGEHLQRRYVDKLSKRMWELNDDEGYHYKTEDVICVYCENCKRYTALERITDDAHPNQTEFYWFYLPRLPKQTELINEEELEDKPPTWKKETDD
jgi:hypothetical protein